MNKISSHNQFLNLELNLNSQEMKQNLINNQTIRGNRKREFLNHLRRNTSDVKTCSTESAALFDAGCLETELCRLNRRHVTSRTATDDDNVVFIGSRRSEAASEGERESESISGRIGDVSGEKVRFSPS